MSTTARTIRSTVAPAMYDALLVSNGGACTALVVETTVAGGVDPRYVAMPESEYTPRDGTIVCAVTDASQL